MRGSHHWDGLLAVEPTADPQALVDGVTAHEGYGMGPGAGHQGRMRDALTGEQCGNINRLLERAVGNGATFAMMVSDILEESLVYLDRESAEAYVGNNYADAEHLLGQDSTQVTGPHTYASTLFDTKTLVPPTHSILCN